jgi:rod shape determining protein RodA
MNTPAYKFTKRAMHIDLGLLGLLLSLVIIGLFILYSASNENLAMVLRQVIRLFTAFGILVVLSFIPPHKYKLWAPRLYFTGLVLLITVVLIGKVGKGAQRWLDFGIVRFQPSEIMKLAVPMMTAWYIDKQKSTLKPKALIISMIIILLPTVLIAKQPDLGTAILVLVAGLSVIFIAGLKMRIIITTMLLAALSAPILWNHMHDYQKQRILTLLHPEQDPLGRGYHIIQSKIAIGSGGTFGKGWLTGSQAHLNFLPEHATDFIFAVSGEELGFIGCSVLIFLIGLITLKSLQIAECAQTTFTQLLAASITMSFFFSAFVNMSMVMGILPVVGIPLPLVSYGGSAMITFLAGFGILMSISSHKILFTELHK